MLNIKLISTLNNNLYKDFAIHCMNNYHIYNNTNDLGCIIIFYKELLTDPKKALGEVLKEWDKLKLSDVNFKKSSSTVASEGVDDLIEIQIAKWKYKLSDKDKLKFQDILDYFGIVLYDMKNGRPNI